MHPNYLFAVTNYYNSLSRLITLKAPPHHKPTAEEAAELADAEYAVELFRYWMNEARAIS